MTRSENMFLAVCVLFIVSAGFGVAQSTADMEGNLVDASHRPVVSAFVIVTGRDTSLMRAATTDEAGNFEFTALPVGQYELQVKADGVLVFRDREVWVNIGQVARLNIVLSTGDASSGTHGHGSTLLVETSNTQLGVVMDSLDVTQLPLKSRDTYELLQLQPGVESTLGTDLFFGSDQPGVVSVNGARARSNSYNVNGGHADDQFVNAPSLQPSPDSISEFRVLSHAYDAELGRNSGSVLNVITKSGTNTAHGSLYEYFRNDALNAKGYFDPQTPDFKQNEFGGTLGGPLWRDRTFFFSSYEGRRVRNGITSDSVVVPSLQERGGDFSSGPTFAGTLQDPTVAAILNARPGCAAAVAARGGAVVAPGSSYTAIFPRNVIPSQCFDPTATALMQQYVPVPNVGASTFRGIPDAKIRQDQITMRLDHNLRNQQQLSFYYYLTDINDDEPFSRFQAVGANLPGFGNRTLERFQQVNLTHNWSINAKTINEARIVYYRDAQSQFLSPQRTGLVQDSCGMVPPSQCFSDPSDPRLGITPGYGPGYEGVPFVALAGGFSIGNNANGSFVQAGNVYQFLDNLSKVLGNHSLKFGIDARNQRFHQTYFFDVNGNFEFTGGGPNDLGFADLVPNYLLGLPDTYTQGAANSLDVRTTQLGFFGQDSWKLRSNLNLYYGLRWELNTPQADAGNRTQAFRPGQATSIYPCVLSPSDPLVSMIGSSDCSPTGPARSVYPLGLVLPGDAGVPQGLTHGYLRSFAPRTGLAWSPTWTHGWLAKLAGGPGRSSVRVGWGMFYDANEELILASFAAQPPFGGSTFIPNVLFNTPFLGQNGTVAPNPFNGFDNPKRGSAVDFALFRPILLFGNFPSTLRSQYAEQYHFTVQRELSRDTLLQFGYVGSQGHRLLASLDQNYGNAQTCLDLNKIPGMSCGPFGEDSPYYIPAGAIPSGVTLHLPYGSVAAVTGPNSNPITLVGLRRYSSPLCEPTSSTGCPPDGVPVFSSLFAMAPVANSSYNAFQAEVKRRLSHGLQLLASYTWSKSLDDASSWENSVNPLNISGSRSLSLFDARHRLVVSEYWRLPAFHPANWSRHVVNGWALSSIASFQSGFPIRITSTSDRELMGSFDFEAPGQPNQIAAFRTMDPRASEGYYFDPASFVDAPLGQIGNAPRAICCGPGIANLDIGVHKLFHMNEGTSLEFRTELFNAFNHTQFLNPSGNITGGTAFGLVTRARDPRVIQSALRLSF
jgi:carboxypeptidase family protein